MFKCTSASIGGSMSLENRKLNLIQKPPYQNRPSDYEITFTLKVVEEVVDISFIIKKNIESPWNVSSHFSSTNYANWGLWEYDVVELFLQRRKEERDLTAPYLEVQLSPLNQRFALIIVEPRKIFFTPLHLFFETDVKLTDDIFKSSMRVKFPDFLFEGELNYFGIFACLGAKKQRNYFGFQSIDNVIDFHRPQLFVKLESMNNINK